MKHSKTLLVDAIFSAVSGAVFADDLLSGTAALSDETPVLFVLNGNSREDVIGGHIIFGDRQFEITSVSEHNLVGAKLNEGDKVHLAVFSSSYSRVTSTGKPWTQGQSHHGSDQPYNYFMTIYEVNSSSLRELTDPPYLQIGENPSVANSLSVYCFMSQPSDWG